MNAHRAPDPTDRPCPICQARPNRPCMALDRRPLPTVHGERTESTPLFDLAVSVVADLVANEAAKPEGEPYAGADHGDWSLRAYDDDPEGHQFLRLVWTHNGAVIDEGRCYTYKVWTVLAHWTDDLPDLEASRA